MQSELLTFGEYLNQLLKRKKLTVTDLAKITHMKSRNSIQRLLKDECSYELIEAFKNKLLYLKPELLSEFEKYELERSIEISKYGKNLLRSRDTLLHLCSNLQQYAPPRLKECCFTKRSRYHTSTIS